VFIHSISVFIDSVKWANAPGDSHENIVNSFTGRARRFHAGVRIQLQRHHARAAWIHARYLGAGTNTMISRGPSFVLTVNGSNFSTQGTINWNGTAQTTTFVSANQLTATIAASDIATPATVAVTVTNPATSGMAMGMDGSGGTMAETSSAMNFTVN